MNRSKMQTGKMAIHSDEELMRFICIGEPEAFDELYHRYAKRLMVYFYRMLDYDKARAEDAVQDVFMKLAEKPEIFDRNRSFKTWVFSVASNYCKNHYRHRTVMNGAATELKYASEETNDHHMTIGNIDAKFFRLMLERHLLELSFEKREVFLLKYQEDKSVAEIAEIQQVSEGTVKSRLHYACSALADKMQDYKP